MTHAKHRTGPRRSSIAIGVAIGIAVIVSVALGAGRPLASEQPRLWTDPGDIASRDLYWGAASEARAPKPPFTFAKEDDSGSKPKIHVRDANGMTWSVKFDRRSGRGREIPAEIAATRIAWALGYFVEETYLVRNGVVEDAARMKRGSRVLDAQGRFELARFEPRPDKVERTDERWTIADNPFTGTRELSGLVVLAALVNDWDFRAGNTTVLRVPGDHGVETRYLVSDWGTAFGRMSPRRSRWDLEDYRERPDFFAVKGDVVELNLHADDTPERTTVPLADARWFAQQAARLTEPQLQRAFAAGGATEAEVRGFAAAVRQRIERLGEAVGASRAGG